MGRRMEAAGLAKTPWGIVRAGMYVVMVATVLDSSLSSDVNRCRVAFFCIWEHGVG